MNAALYHARIAALQARLVQAEAERDGLYTSRDQHRYELARARVEALSDELWVLRLAHLHEDAAAK